MSVRRTPHGGLAKNGSVPTICHSISGFGPGLLHVVAGAAGRQQSGSWNRCENECEQLTHEPPPLDVMKNQVIIDRRYCGPPDSGNGGYVCGLVAGFLEGEVEVTLRRPPPLDTPMTVQLTGQQHVRLLEGSDLVAEGRSNPVVFDIPVRPSFEQARLASRGYSGFDQHFYPTCFVCGPARKAGDGLRVFAGPLPADDGVAAPWVPDPSLADATGNVAAEFVWAALDCPGYFAVNSERHRYMLLGRMAAAIHHRPRPGDRCVVVAWHSGSEGRKHFALSALLTDSGNLLGQAVATWIEIDRPL